MRWLGLALVIAGCGDNRSPCDYAETDDVGNSTTAEASGLVLANVTRLCGSIDPDHFDVATNVVDVDRIRFTQPVDGDVVVRLGADDGITVLNGLAVRIFDTAANPTLIAEISFVEGHAVQLVGLAAGDYQLAVTAKAGGPVDVAIPYLLELATNHCEAATGEPYREGTANNDAISIDYAKSPIVTSQDGTPEDTGLEVTANNALHLAGTATGDAHADSYADRDTYVIRTDETANELTIRLDWTDDAADLDFFLFDPTTLRSLAAGDLGTQGAVEKRVFSVAPSSAYVLWVGSYAGTHAPVDYDVTVCGTHFFH